MNTKECRGKTDRSEDDLPVQGRAVHADEHSKAPRAPLGVRLVAVETPPVVCLGQKARKENVSIEELHLFSCSSGSSVRAGGYDLPTSLVSRYSETLEFGPPLNPRGKGGTGGTTEISSSPRTFLSEVALVSLDHKKENEPSQKRLRRGDESRRERSSYQTESEKMSPVSASAMRGFGVRKAGLGASVRARTACAASTSNRVLEQSSKQLPTVEQQRVAARQMIAYFKEKKVEA